MSNAIERSDWGANKWSWRNLIMAVMLLHVGVVPVFAGINQWTSNGPIR